MSHFFKSKKYMAIFMSAVIIVITFAAGSVAYFLGGKEFLLNAISPSEASTAELSSSETETELKLESTPESQAAQEVETEIEIEKEPEPIKINIPVEMRGVYLTPGVDILVKGYSSQDAVKAEIDTALANAVKLTMNSVIIDTVYKDKVIFNTANSSSITDSFDIMEYIVQKSRDNNLYTYAIFDASPYQQKNITTAILATGAGATNTLSTNIKDFAQKYKLDGILIDGYQNTEEPNDYSMYRNLGGAIGYDNFMKQSPAAIVKISAKTIKQYAPNTQVGLLADAVWKNATDDEMGSKTKAKFTAMGTANADTKAFVEDGIVDFVAVKAFSSTTNTAEPFLEVAQWWSTIAQKADMPLYLVHASSKICTEETGWESHDQLTRQIIESGSLSGYNGSVFDSLSRMVSNPKDATTTLIKYYNNEIEAAHILSELEMTKPEKLVFTTFEPNMTFTGASDPNSPVEINGTLIPTDESGYFTVEMELKPGENKFAITHKEKKFSYVITRQVKILGDISPTDAIATDGGVAITITALAYSDAKVVATINGKSIEMLIDDSVEDELDRGSNYKLFVGEYTVPATTQAVQNLGNITVTAIWEGQKDSKQGASIKVNKRAKIEDGVPIVITAAQAYTYPANTVNNIANSNYYPLPQGAMDYAVGEEIVYTSNKATFKYFVLASGMRVESSNMKPTGEFASGNKISALAVDTENGYTYVRLKSAQKVSYNFKYTGSEVQIKLNYTDTVPKNIDLSQNPLFSSAKWQDNTLILPLIKQGGFMGYKGYFDDKGNLVFRFNNPPSSISSAKIAIDPGHGGSDSGAPGFLAQYPEKIINLGIANQLKEQLEERGATVLLLNTSGGMSTGQRVLEAEKWGADIFVSVHNNTAPRASAIGTEVYYFYPFSRNLALNAASNVSSKFNTTNRGARQSYYHVTLSSQFASVLVECGFMTNQSEYEKLVKSKNRGVIATGIANGLEAAIKAAYTGSSLSGSESVGGSISAGEDSSSESSEDSATIDTENDSITLNKSSATLTPNETLELIADVMPEDAEITWKSGNTSVATVDSDGVVTAHKEGKAKITSTLDTKKSASCQIEVVEESNTNGKKLADAKEVYLKFDELTIKKGKTEKVIVDSDIGEIRPTDFTWESSDLDIATVDKNGNVKAISKGEVEITAVSSDQQHGLLCTIVVE